jgi:hypothetical protein
MVQVALRVFKMPTTQQDAVVGEASEQ